MHLSLSEICHRSTFAFPASSSAWLDSTVPHPSPAPLLSWCLDSQSSGPPRSGFLSIRSNTFERGINLKLLGIKLFSLFLTLNFGLLWSLRLSADLFSDASFPPSTFTTQFSSSIFSRYVFSLSFSFRCLISQGNGWND